MPRTDPEQRGAARLRAPPSRPTARTGVAAAVLAAALLASCGGCGWSICSNVQFSPDGRTIAFCRDSGTFVGFTVGPTPYGLGQDAVSVYWCSAENPTDKRSVRVDSRGPFFPPQQPQESVKAFAFSPDSRHLAIRTEKRLLLADLSTGRSWALDAGDEQPHTVTWLGSSEVAYATTVKFRGPYPQSELRIFRQKTDAAPDERTEVHRDDFDIGVGRLFWSPSGRYVLLQPTWHGVCKLLDVATGKAWSFGAGAIELHACAWKRDSSAAFCVIKYTPEKAEDPTAPPRQILLLIEPASAKRTHLLGEDVGLALGVPGAAWTAEGGFVLIDDGWAGCWLIQPEPWRAIPLKDKLVNTLRAHGSAITSWQALHPFPVAGWLLMQDHDGKSFVVNPDRQACVPIGEGSSWAYSPDGQRVAEVDNKATVTVRDLGLAPTPYAPGPPLRPAPATRPAGLPLGPPVAPPTPRPATAPTSQPTTRPAQTE